MGDSAYPETSLGTFLANLVPRCRNEVQWGAIRLEVDTYVVDYLPPVEYISSVRAVVTAGNQLLVLRDHGENQSILPGGRCEPGELPVETLRRELREEVGVEVQTPDLVGLLHFRHLGPRPVDYMYPYPDFVQLVYRAELDHHIPNFTVSDGFVKDSALQSIDRVRSAALPQNERPFLKLLQSPVN